MNAEGEAVPWAAQNPATQAVALIYGTLHVHKLKKPEASEQVPTFDQLTKAGSMAGSTTRDCFKQMLPYMVLPGKIFSEKDAPAEDLTRLGATLTDAMGSGSKRKRAAVHVDG